VLPRHALHDPAGPHSELSEEIAIECTSRRRGEKGVLALRCGKTEDFPAIGTTLPARCPCCSAKLVSIFTVPDARRLMKPTPAIRAVCSAWTVSLVQFSGNDCAARRIKKLRRQRRRPRTPPRIYLDPQRRSSSSIEHEYDRATQTESKKAGSKCKKLPKLTRLSRLKPANDLDAKRSSVRRIASVSALVTFAGQGQAKSGRAMATVTRPRDRTVTTKRGMDPQRKPTGMHTRSREKHCRRQTEATERPRSFSRSPRIASTI
jgi:hypothetical protein